MMKQPSLRKNIASMLLWQMGNYVIPLLTFPYLTRVLGVKQFGVYALSFALISYCCLLVDWGFLLGAPGQIARAGNDNARINEVFWSTFIAKVMLMLLTFIVIGIATLAFPSVWAIAPVLWSASGMVVANILTVNWCLQGLERLGKLATAAMIGRALTVPATFVLVHGVNDAWIAALIQSGGALIAGIVSIVMLRSMKLISRPAVTSRHVLNQLQETWPLFVSALSSNIYTSTNTVVLGVVAGPAQTGLFSSADRLRAAAQAMITPVSQAVYPRVTRMMADDRGDAMRIVRLLLLIQGGLTLCIAGFLIVFADYIIHILAGPKFIGAVPVMRLLAFIPFMVGVSNVLGVQLMLPLGMKKVFSRITMAAAIINLAIVIPLSWYWGALGTATSALVAETFVAGAMILVLMRSGISIFSNRTQKI